MITPPPSMTTLKPLPSNFSLSMNNAVPGGIQFFPPLEEINMMSSAIHLLRGGGGAGSIVSVAETALDLDRIKIRLEGLSTYGVISILLMNCALGLYTSVPKKIKSKHESEYNKIENIVTVLFTLSSTITIIAGTNTSIIFSLLNLYSNTALGMAKDYAFLDFLSSTAGIRTFGFQSMITSLIGLKLSFVFSVYLLFKGKARYMLSGFTCIVSIASSVLWMSVIQKASVLFT